MRDTPRGSSVVFDTHACCVAGNARVSNMTLAGDADGHSLALAVVDKVAPMCARAEPLCAWGMQPAHSE